MPLVPALCTQCGSKLEVDSGKEAGICPHCHTPFVTEKVINNYNITNITNIGNLHADVVQINESKSIDNQVKAGETFIKLNEYESAENVFRKLTHEFPYDYRGWWGLIRVYTLDFGNISISRETLNYIDNLYENATAVMVSESDKSEAKKIYSDFRAIVENNLITEEKHEAQIRKKRDIELKRQAEERDIELKRQRDEEKRELTQEITETKKTVFACSGIVILTMLFVLFEIWARHNGTIVPDTINIMSKQISIHILIHIGVYAVMLLAFKFALDNSVSGVVIFCVIATLGGVFDSLTSVDVFKDDVVSLCLMAGVILFNVVFLIVYYKKYGKVCSELWEKENRLQELTRDLKSIG